MSEEKLYFVETVDTITNDSRIKLPCPIGFKKKSDRDEFFDNWSECNIHRFDIIDGKPMYY